MSELELVTEILGARLKDIYGDTITHLEIVDTMPYPMRDHLVLVRYNITVKDQVPTLRAQIVIDKETRELKKFEPSLL